MENKSYVGYDDTLRTGPYNFSEAVTRPDWVEHFSYQNGLLVWYVNHSVADNNTSQHPGSGYALPVDATVAPLSWSNGGGVARNRIQAFDATFGLETTDPLTLHRQVARGRSGYQQQTVSAAARRMVNTFDDSNPSAYWDKSTPAGSVKVAGVGVLARVTAQTADTITVHVTNP